MCVQRMIAAHCKVSGEGGCGGECERKKETAPCLSLTPGASNAAAVFALRSRGRPVLTCVVADEFTGSAGEALCALSMSRYCIQRETALGDILLSSGFVMVKPRS